MKPSKVMVVSLGMGLANADEGVENLAKALLGSISAAHPDKLFLVVTRQSQVQTLPHVTRGVTIPYETILLDDSDDIESIYATLYPRFKEIRNEYGYLTVDYTSGTKAMTAALVLLGTLFDAENLTYVGGRRQKGIVVKGTEKLNVVKPLFASVERRIQTTISFFNSCQYDTALAIIADIRSITADPRIIERIEPLERASRAYSLWDNFQHERAFSELKQLKLDVFANNKRFLGKMQTGTEKEPYLIADLINNAKRRGSIGSRFDDAVGRLYRVMELVAQYKLKSYGISDTGNVAPDKVGEELRKRWQTHSNDMLQLGLHKSYQLLGSKADKLGLEYQQDKRLQNLLANRNNSILAHGTVPVAKEIYEELLDKARVYASMAVPKLDQLCQDGEFARWPD